MCILFDQRCIFKKREDLSVIKGLLSESFRYRRQPSRGGGEGGDGGWRSCSGPSSDLAAVHSCLLCSPAGSLHLSEHAQIKHLLVSDFSEDLCCL